METAVHAETRSENMQPVASHWHTLLVLAVVAATLVRSRLRMHGVTNLDRSLVYERTMLSEWLLLGLVLAGVWLHGSSLSTVMGDRWRSLSQFFRDAGIGVLFMIASTLISSVLGAHGDAADKATQFLLPQNATEIALWFALSFSAGICEEAVYRGYLQKQFIALTKSVPIGIVLPALAFGAAHSYQGVARASLIGVMGVAAGVLAYWCRSVRPGMISHTLQDVLGGLVRH